MWAWAALEAFREGFEITVPMPWREVALHISPQSLKFKSYPRAFAVSPCVSTSRCRELQADPAFTPEFSCRLNYTHGTGFHRGFGNRESSKRHTIPIKTNFQKGSMSTYSLQIIGLPTPPISVPILKLFPPFYLPSPFSLSLALLLSRYTNEIN